MEKLITIKRLGINGEGIGYYKRKTVFVEGALPGEEVICEFTKEHPNYIAAKTVEIKKASKHRVDPPCPYFEKCGGCQLQHLDYKKQLNMKKDIIMQALNRYLPGFKNMGINIKRTIGMDDSYNYRNKAQLPVALDNDKIVTGLYEANTNKLIYIDKCIIQEDIINRMIYHTKDILMKYNIKVFNKKSGGILRYITVRYINNTNEAQVVLVLKENQLAHMEEVAKELFDLFPELKSFYVSINSKINTHEIYGREFIHIKGKKEIEAKIDNKLFFLSPQSFFQLNTKQTEVLYNVVKKSIDFKKTDKIIDAYCGAGAIGIFLSDLVKEVRGVDLTAKAIQDAKHNAKINHLSNTYFEAGHAEKIIPKWINAGFKPDVLLVDPPRTGLDSKLINLLRKIKINKFIYVSCNPSTLAKDLNELKDVYQIKLIQPVDMFPQTSHVESVVLLVRK